LNIPPPPTPVTLPHQTLPTSPTSVPMIPTGRLVLPAQPDAKSIQRMQEAGYPTGFRSIVQFQAYWLMKQRQRHLLYVAGTGSGKTASVQLAIKSLGPEAQVLLLLPYKALYAEMEKRMQSFGLSVVHYDSNDEFPSAQVVISTPGALAPTSHLMHGLKQRANQNRLLAIVIDEAVSCLISHFQHQLIIL